jgi:DNA polymerase-1
MGFVAPSDKCWLSLDYSGQELMIATAWSKDEMMTRAFTEPEVLTTPEGKSYKNPYADLHTLTAVTCCSAELFEGVSEYDWVALSKENKSRQKGKITNFGLIYLQTAESLSLLNHIKLEETKKWVQQHRKVYSGYHRWAEEYGRIGAARGFAVSPVSGLIRWVDEENSKGGGTESPARAAVNHGVQGEAAQMMKEALIGIKRQFKNEVIKIANTVHDESNILIPGKCWVNLDKCTIKDGVITNLVYDYEDSVKEIAEAMAKIMIDTETEFFKAAGCPLIGRVDWSVAPYWKH